MVQAETWTTVRSSAARAQVFGADTGALEVSDARATVGRAVGTVDTGRVGPNHFGEVGTCRHRAGEAGVREVRALERGAGKARALAYLKTLLAAGKGQVKRLPSTSTATPTT